MSHKTGKIMNCENCDAPIYINGFRLKQKNHFCKEECWKEFRRKNAKQYLRTVDESDNRIMEHRKVWQTHHGLIPQGYEIHHLNENKKDNRIENLKLIKKEDHVRLHFKKQPVTKICIYCSKEYSKPPWQMKNRKYCSPQCWWRARWQK